MQTNFARRSLLYIPGSSEKMLAKAKDVKADAVILDLEDSVSELEKDKARTLVIRTLQSLQDRRKERMVRINAPESLWFYQDVMAVMEIGVDALVLPKADEKSLYALDLLMCAMENKLGMPLGKTGILALFETSHAIANAYSILAASRRIVGAQLGAEDLTKEMGIVRTVQGNELLFARHQLALAAHAHGVDAIDSPFTEIACLTGLEDDTRFVKSIGFTGKACIHPNHIETINRCFSPTQEEIRRAQGMLTAYENAIREGKGACKYENQMVDKPVAERAQTVLNKAKRFGIEF